MQKIKACHLKCFSDRVPDCQAESCKELAAAHQPQKAHKYVIESTQPVPLRRLSSVCTKDVDSNEDLDTCSGAARRVDVRIEAAEPCRFDSNHARVHSPLATCAPIGAPASSASCFDSDALHHTSEIHMHTACHPHAHYTHVTA